MDIDVSDLDYAFPLLIITGKGGVGKTVLTAAVGSASARRGHSTLIVEIAGKEQLPPLLTNNVDKITNAPPERTVHRLAEGLQWEAISPDRLLARWLSGHSMGLIADRLEKSGALSVIASSIPGIRDVLFLGYLRALVESGKWDRIILDGPASGRLREMLRAPRQVAEVAAEGPVFEQATQAHGMLTDPETTGIVLVTLPEEMPVNETIETAFDVEDDPGVQLAGVVVNRIFPESEPPRSFDAHPFGGRVRARFEMNTENVERLEAELPVPRVTTRENARGVSSPADLDELIDPAVAQPLDPDSGGAQQATPEGDPEALNAALQAQIVVTVGTGGVGKTTIGAALAVRAAQAGKSVALVTIDPAKRLKDSLGLTELDDELREVPLGGAGRLQATMLDPGSTFERLVRSHAQDETHAQRILGNPLGAQLADSLSGMTEYMAVERLWELHTDPEIDLVVLDTPPSADALEFLDAPNLLARLLDNRLYGLLVHGKRGSIVNRALGGIVGQLVSVLGGTVVNDAVEFFRSFEGIEAGFRERGDAIHEILRGEKTAFVVVATATGRSLNDAVRFAGQLGEAGVSPSLTAINRLTPPVPPAEPSAEGDAIVDHIRRRRAAELENLAAQRSSIATPLIVVEDQPTPVASIETVIALADQLA